MRGIALEFCAPDEVAPGLALACARMEDPSEPPLACAVELYARVLNLHPFLDGNGRVARILLNHCLHRMGMPTTTYLPLKELFWHARGGHELALREAEIYGEWNPLMLYFSRTILLLVRLFGAVRPSEG